MGIHGSDFAADVSEFETLAEYKADIKAKIKEQKAAEGKRKQEDQAVEQAIKNAEDVTIGQNLQIHLYQGRLKAVVEEIELLEGRT